MRFVIIVILALLVALLLTACSSIPLGTAWKLSRMQPEDLLSADPAGFRIATQTEKIFFEHMPDTDISLQFTLTAGEDSLLDERFEFVDTTAQEHWIVGPPDAGQAWRIYALDPAQLDRFRAMLSRLDGFRTSGSETGPEKSFGMRFMFEGEGGIDDDGNLAEGAKALPKGTTRRWAEEGLFVDVLVRLDRESEFMVLLRNWRHPFELVDSAAGP